MKRTLGFVLVGLALFGANPGPDPPEQWLQYRHSPARGEIPMTYETLALTPEPPPGVALPAFRATDPLFGKWLSSLAPGGGRWLALDRSRKLGGHDLLFIDGDGDGSLADETALAARSIEDGRYSFSPVRVLLPGEDGPVTYHFRLLLPAEGTPMAWLVGCGWYEGAVRIDGETWRCRLVDWNLNGAFDDAGLDFEQTDRIQIGREGALETYLVGHFIRLEGKLRRLAVARDGAWVSFAPAGEVPEGTLSVPPEAEKLSVGGPNGLFAVRPGEADLVLPVGEYRTYRWQVSRKDGKGKTWTLEGTGRPDGSPLRIEAGRRTAPALFEPVGARLEHETVADGEHLFSLTLAGPLGDHLYLRREQETSKPILRICDGEGKELKSLPFQPG